MKIAIDSSVLVALINPQVLWRNRAVNLQQALTIAQAELHYFDCVVTESISVVARRLLEKGEVSANIEALLNQLKTQVPYDTITWILPDVPRLYPEVLDLIRSSSGALNFNDALIALACQERRIPAIASFDSDFDQITWLKRMAQPEDVTP